MQSKDKLVMHKVFRVFKDYKEPKALQFKDKLAMPKEPLVPKVTLGHLEILVFKVFKDKQVMHKDFRVFKDCRV